MRIALINQKYGPIYQYGIGTFSVREANTAPSDTCFRKE